ncbi:M23 family metallopeptidase [Mesorhizobium microcysteis]|uniref:M23 family metallopeptidase n=1 Tax=Neoaquamicrobium microcysteis TaxID=2682781 RepID=A0A5D4GS72_9HYPH|nr:M23 family metallopeptidase [Mesorhizobium microcysteis]
MSVTEYRQASAFGKRREPHTVIIARGDDIRHFTIRPWLAAFVGSVLAAMAIGYLLATSYLVLRDDLLGATAARQARMQQAYEDRISMLRAQVDRITSRQILDQQLVESKVSELLARQSQLTQRHGRIGPILDRVKGEAGGLPESAPLPASKPELRAANQPVIYADSSAASFWSKRPAPSGPETAADRADRLFVAINQSLRAIESEQMDGIGTLTENAFKTADEIASALEAAGLPVDIDTDDEAVGGPLLPIDAGMIFEARVRELDEALEKLETLKAIAKEMPIHNPAPGKPVTSSFGVRRDPIIKRPAMHAGIDFRAPTGTEIKSAGAGKVIKAGWNGGYGRMVEIDHGNGLTTRYAHMSRIRVSQGDTVDTGDVVGEAGSTGRSTGPHLHYEVRRNGTAIDPLRFLKAGKAIGKLL